MTDLLLESQSVESPGGSLIQSKSVNICKKRIEDFVGWSSLNGFAPRKLKLNQVEERKVNATK